MVWRAALPLPSSVTWQQIIRRVGPSPGKKVAIMISPIATSIQPFTASLNRIETAACHASAIWTGRGCQLNTAAHEVDDDALGQYDVLAFLTVRLLDAGYAVAAPVAEMLEDAISPRMVEAEVAVRFKPSKFAPACKCMASEGFRSNDMTRYLKRSCLGHDRGGLV